MSKLLKQHLHGIYQKVSQNAYSNMGLDSFYEERVRIDDTEATKIIIKVARVENTTQVQSLEKEKRDKIIEELKNRGLSIRQIERLTGVSFGIIRRI